MKGLLIKDIALLNDRRKLITYLAIMLLFSFNVQTIPYLAVIINPFLTMTITLGTIAMDGADNSERFLFSLPISRKTYTREKYLLSFIGAVVGLILAALLIVALFAIKQNPIDLPSFGLVLLGGLLFVSVYLAVSLPLQLKFQGEKNQSIVLVATMGVIIVIFFGFQQLPQAWLVKGLAILQKMIEEPVLSVIVVFGLCILLLGCSYLIAKKIMAKKSF
ncbi:ABC-2 transporter permease [Enterococcus sp. HY326]|uniref:ABC-2 transporter permease n=1 Tax=Enterococcus sp. HY326 TaxID=2971265 RepID=UPI00223E94D7|nr:ABC-2 transporter permease [Enterococcus sp. HY326]